MWMVFWNSSIYGPSGLPVAVLHLLTAAELKALVNVQEHVMVFGPHLQTTWPLVSLRKITV